MGMDLYPVRPQTRKAKRGFSVNLSAWADLIGLLEQFGCNTTEMSSVNDGNRIRAGICREWGQAIRDQIGNIRNLQIKQKLFPNSSDFTTGLRLTIAGIKPTSLCLEGKEEEVIRALSRKLKKRITRADYKVTRLSQEDIQWLKEVSHFFENCGGCRQY